MNEVDLYRSLGRWFGYGPRWRWLLDDVLAALSGPRHVAIAVPRGAAIHELASVLRSLDHSARVAVVENGAHEARALGTELSAGRTRLILLAVGRTTEAMPAMVVPGATVERVPAIAERRDDLARLLAEARARTEATLGLGRARIRPDLHALYARPWLGHLDEIEQVMRSVVALRTTGSLRRAAAAIGTTKSTLSDQLRAVGVCVVRE